MTTSNPNNLKGNTECRSAPAGTQLGRGGRRREHSRLAPIRLKALAALSEQGLRHGANATGALGQTKRNQPNGRPKPLSPRRYWGFGAQSGQPGQSTQRYINPSRTSWNDGGAGGGSAESRSITPADRADPLRLPWSSGSRGAAAKPSAPNGEARSCRAHRIPLGPALPRSHSTSADTSGSVDRFACLTANV